MILEEESRQEGRIIHHPSICSTSAKLVEHKRDQPVYERLYDISKEKRQKDVRKMMEDTPEASIDLSMTSPDDKETSFAPKINKKSEDIV